MNVSMDHLALAVADPARTARSLAAAFDGQVLDAGPAGAGPAEWSVMLGGVRLVLVAGAGPRRPGLAHVALRVQGTALIQMAQRLRDVGFQVEAPRHGATDRALYFLDHDNNLFEVCVGPMPTETQADEVDRG